MKPLSHYLIVTVVAGGAFVIANLCTTPFFRAAPQARWFMPGYWGQEPGARPLGPSEGAWLTRSMSGFGSKKSDKVWEEQNLLGGRMNFSHSLRWIIRPEDYAAHPEWFPMEGGKRFKPALNTQNWQPDLGSESVATRAAEIATAALRSSVAERVELGGLGLQGSTNAPRSATAATVLNSSPSAHSFGLGINDTVFYGDSPDTMRLVTPLTYFRGRPNYSDLVFTFMNRVAENVERSLTRDQDHLLRTAGSPVAAGVDRGANPNPPSSARSATAPAPFYLGCLAYYWCEQVPNFKIHPSIVPYLCADRSQGYDPAFRTEERELQERWGRAHANEAGRGQRPEAGSQKSEKSFPASRSFSGARLGIYDYLDGFGFLIPRVHTRLLAEHLKHARQSGFTDYYGEASPNWGLDGPQMWLVAQLLAHPEAEASVLLDEYYSRYFAEAAVPMRRFYERCEEIWMAQSGPAKWLKYYRNEGQTQLFPSSECRKLRAMLDDAKASARQEKVRKRIELVSDAFSATERFVAYEEAKRALSALNAQGEGSSVAELVELGGSGDKAPRSALLASRAAPVGSATFADAALGCVAARAELERTIAEVKRRQPLALFNGELKDFTWSEPVYDGVLNAGSAEFGGTKMLRSATAATGQRVSPGYAAAIARVNSEQVLTCSLEAPSFEESVIQGRRVGGLQYGADVPQVWRSNLEPKEGMIAAVLPEAARTGKAGLRLANQEYASVYQWVLVHPDSKGYEVEAWFRGELSDSARVSLFLTWIDEDGEFREDLNYGVKFLPERARVAGGSQVSPVQQLDRGGKARWTRLRTGSLLPAKAKWVGVVILVNFMLPGDWVDVDDVTLTRFK